jgi:hypothetical protein
MGDLKLNSSWYDPAPNAKLIQIIVLNVVLFFVSLIRDLSGLSPLSLVGILSVIYTIFVMSNCLLCR